MTTRRERHRRRHGLARLRISVPVVLAVGVALIAASTLGARQQALIDPTAPGSSAPVPTHDAQSPDQQVTAADAASPSVLFIGDSYTSGEVLADADQRFTTLISDELGWQEENVALGGTGYFTQVVDEDGEVRPDYTHVLETLPSDLTPDAIMITGGGNDTGSGLTAADQASRIDEFFIRLRERFPQTPVYVVSPFWNAGEEPTDLPTIRDDVQRSALAAQATYLDIGHPLEGHPDLVLGDGDHPNDRGNEVIANDILTALQQATDEDLAQLGSGVSA